MAVIATTVPTAAGTVRTATAVTASDTFAAVPGRTVLTVINGNASPTNVTLTSTANAPDGTAQANRVITVANGTSKDILITSGMVDASGVCAAAFSVTATVTAVVVTV